MHDGIHHAHVRKRLYVNLEPFPHPDFLKRFLDRIIYVVGFLGPAFTIPQVYDIYAFRDATSVSVLSWSAFALLDVVWIVYGIVHKERVITFTYTLWLIANMAVAIGAMVYGAGDPR